MNYFDRRKKYLMKNKKNEYIKKGLQLWIDGIENTREGHSSDKLIQLYDISENDYDFTILGGSTVVPEKNCIPFNKNCVYGCSNETLQDLMMGLKNRTIEIVCSISDSDSNAKVIFLGGKNNNLNSGAGLWYRPTSAGLCVSGNSKAHKITNIENVHTYSVIYDDIAINNTKVYQDNALTETVSGGTMASSSVCVGGRYYNGTSTYRFSGNIYCIRVYDRQLTQEEREHNRKIDIERFGI